MKKRSGVAQRLMEVALPLTHSPGTQAALMATAAGAMHGRRIAGRGLQKGRQLARKIRLPKVLTKRSAAAMRDELMKITGGLE